eukprot:13414171-Alexandrium_andersonii.AAC.1
MSPVSRKSSASPPAARGCAAGWGHDPTKPPPGAAPTRNRNSKKPDFGTAMEHRRDRCSAPTP